WVWRRTRRRMSGRRRDSGEIGAKEKGKGEENVERILGMGKKGRGILGNRRKRRKRTLGEKIGEQVFILDENGSWGNEGSKTYRRKGEM
ncbi:hypothetical protein C7212DRAFT_303910, partial [Tuber magnatum]